MEWYCDDKNVKIRDNRVVVKLRNVDKSIKECISIPTMYYPLSERGKIKVFNDSNTECVTDKFLLDLIDSVKYNIGRCYTNSDKLLDILKDSYNVVAYAGWLFVGETEYPIHHSWLVIDDKYLIDLADDFSCLDNYCESHNIDKNSCDTRKLVVDFTTYASKLLNSERCYPLGKCHSMLFYVGCECLPNEAKREYQKLIKQFPDHKVQRNCNERGLNLTQSILANAGLL